MTTKGGAWSVVHWPMSADGGGSSEEVEGKDGGEEEADEDFIPCPHEFSLANSFRLWKYQPSSTKSAEAMALKIKIDKFDMKGSLTAMKKHNADVKAFLKVRRRQV